MGNIKRKLNNNDLLDQYSFIANHIDISMDILNQIRNELKENDFNFEVKSLKAMGEILLKILKPYGIEVG